MQTLRTPSLKRSHLLAGAGAALAIMLAGTSAQAQTASNANGVRTLSNHQADRAGVIRADVDEPTSASIVTGPVTGTELEIGDNAIETAARGNDAALVVHAELTGDDGYGPTRLIAGPGNVDANGATVIANRQMTATSSVVTDIFPSELRITAGPAASSTLTVSRNTADAEVLGNEGAAEVTLTGSRSDSGAGIASFQSTGTGGVAARSRATTGLTVGETSGSRLDNNTNRDRATATSNSADNRVAADVAAIEVPTSNDVGATVPMSGTGDPQTAASFGLLSQQSATGGVAKARVGAYDGSATFDTVIAGDTEESSVTSDANGLDAFAYGNRSANTVALDANTIIGAPNPLGAAPGAVASLTNVQRADVNPIVGSSSGGTAIEARGDVIDSSISASENSFRTIATANLAGNQLVVDAGSIDAVGGNFTTTGHAAAVVEPDGSARMGSAFGVQNVQDFGRSAVAANQELGATAVTVRGAAKGSALRAEGNSAIGTATGNNVTNLLTLDASSVRSHAAVSSLQTGNGTVDVSLGSLAERSGASLIVEDEGSDARLFIIGNRLTGTAIGSTGTNQLTVSASTITGSGVGNAGAGPVDTGYGAAGTFALASNQKLGEPTATGVQAPRVASSVLGAFGAAPQDGLDRSSVEIAGNAQRANAIGNTGLNQLDVSSAVLEDSVTTSLSAFQYGQATIAATSDATITAPRALDQSTVSITGNSSIALGVVNDTDNSLSVSGARTGTAGTAARLDAAPLGPPAASGDHVLANQQFAAGSVGATSTLSVSSLGGGGGLATSGFAVPGNSASAEASANRASNTVSVASMVGNMPGTGLVNAQGNAARVTASAQADWEYGSFVAGGIPATNSSIAIDGNAISALARGNAADNSVSVSVGMAGAAPAATTLVDRFDASLQATAALLNTQSNYELVAATATDTSMPLNGPGAAIQSRVAMTGNSMTASAYGNTASNTVGVSGLGQAPGAAIANAQVNYGNVTALVTGAGFAGAPGPMTGSAFSINGNQLAASAVGNQVSSAITTPR